MVKKKIINSNRLRRIEGGFSFIPHRFLTDGFLSSLTQKEILLYFFLVLASDRYGLSFYSYDMICSFLEICADEYIIARDDGSYITVVTPRESEEVLESGSEVIVVESSIGYARILPVDLSKLDKGAGAGQPSKDGGEGPASDPGTPWMDPDKDLDIEFQKTGS